MTFQYYMQYKDWLARKRVKCTEGPDCVWTLFTELVLWVIADTMSVDSLAKLNHISRRIFRMKILSSVNQVTNFNTCEPLELEAELPVNRKR